MIGILAYGSLLADPGAELAEAIVDRIPVTTPFAVEYARSSSRRAGAPTLVPVAPEFGNPVSAQILVLRADLSEQEVKNRLYRREINQVEDYNCIYDDARQRAREDVIAIETARDLGGVPTVFYASLKANIPEILRADLSAEAKAAHLAELALASVTPETYAEERDGIRYLADAIAHGIETPLTDLYRAAILRLADNAPDLEAARLWAARRQGLLEEKA